MTTLSSNGETFDVAIVGYGPVGAALGNLLGKAGLSVLILERDAGPSVSPRAVSFDLEIMRVFRALGIAEDIAAIARPSSQGTHFINAQGDTLLRRRGFNWLFHQPHLEAVLRRGVERYSTVVVRPLHDVTGINCNDRGALVTAKDLAAGTDLSFQARYVVGCDGARSFVRRQMGSSMEDLGSHQPWLVVDLLLDMDSPAARALPEYSVQWCDPERPMTFFWVGGNRRRWEIMLMPGDDPARMTEPANFWPLLSRWLKQTDATIERSAVYTFHSLLARGWRRGPLLLAGDSCHQTPPFLGQGLCAGFRDAVNLAWKLEAIVKKGATPEVLDTYESERRPHARAFIELAVKLGGIIQATDREAAAERDRQFVSGADKIFEYPKPQLGSGIWNGGPPPNGQLFPEARLNDGRYLEESAAGRFAVICHPFHVDMIGPETEGIWRRLGVAVISDLSQELMSTLSEWQAAAVFLRPDGYVFGIAGDDADLARLTEQLNAVLSDTLSGV